MESIVQAEARIYAFERYEKVLSYYFAYLQGTEFSFKRFDEGTTEGSVHYYRSFFHLVV